jgi:MFS family permease
MPGPATNDAAGNSRPRRLRGRRRSFVAAYANAAWWGLGSGLASTTLITYLARTHGAAGAAIGWILAAPSFVGLLRLATPLWLRRVASRRAFCTAMFLASAAVLAALPALAASGALPSARRAVVALAATWAGYQVLEYIAVVALWSWLGDLAPRPVRGRFLGRREAWLNAGLVVGTVAAIGVTELYARVAAPADGAEWQRQSYITCAYLGAAAFAVSALTLLGVAEIPQARPVAAPRGFRLRDLAAPLVDPPFRRLLAFGLWFSASNGLVQAAQSIFPMAVLDLPFARKRLLDGSLRAGKGLISPRVGRIVDRRGNVPVLAAAQAIIAVAPLWLLFATPAAPWWILGAYACWLAYAGHDVALPNLMLGLSRPGETPAYAAAWFAWTQLAYAVSTLTGGLLLDWLSAHMAPIALGGRPVDHYAALLAASWLLKWLAIPLAQRIPEPQALGASAPMSAR